MAAMTPLARAGDDDDDEGGEGGESGLGDAAQIQVTGSIPPICEFTTLPAQSSLGTIEQGTVTELGALGFTCNIAMSGAINLTVVSANGALRREDGAQTVAYEIAWNIQGSVDAFDGVATSPTGFNLLSGQNGVEQLGAYKVKITGLTAGLPAGTYGDTLTFTISP